MCGLELVNSFFRGDMNGNNIINKTKYSPIVLAHAETRETESGTT